MADITHEQAIATARINRRPHSIIVVDEFGDLVHFKWWWRASYGT